ncbi:hypothetical protein HanRHA438_Chr11g0521521 [Helianthus annuus]|uniref:Uncharacterized protein n=1 Tax=Helianthus annuus TaxID=4232 RepID=A0A251TCJ0_HELAN|nr:hypothetical protein HanXRQr2_Chr11g0509131 [Helianthus annuus]KAJ0511054.1 hypothetical protein HanIR_Chr11g0547661 [Helianthus annuus]KAJ0872241.1 hypothetical protein HanRHA438_Chr11g0521521 [Helianthus annuus]KAJ0876623.1 hypothetical protein HanPSC8_Chr11g0490541 [Helianthus annuus]
MVKVFEKSSYSISYEFTWNPSLHDFRIPPISTSHITPSLVAIIIETQPHEKLKNPTQES